MIADGKQPPEHQEPISASYIHDVFLRIIQKYDELLDELEWAAGEVSGTPYEMYLLDLFKHDFDAKNSLLEKIKEVKTV
jgi:hypothetical protein